MTDSDSPLRIGWAQADITPEGRVFVAGQFYARLSEETLDPITTTALALETDDDHAVLVSCDLVGIPHSLRDAVRARLDPAPEGLDVGKVVFNATHTHTAPDVRIPGFANGHTSTGLGIDLQAMTPEDYYEIAAPRIADAVRRAWESRAPGGLAFGMGWAVVGRNRRWVDTEGRSTMYGKTDTTLFSHIEGYEDHSLGIVATADAAGRLTGLIVNIHSSSQVSEHLFALSADYWCETRAELRRRFGADLFVLPQCSAAGDQSPHLLYDKRACARMLELAGRTERQEIAHRITRAVEDVLPLITADFRRTLPMAHRVETIDLPMNALTEDDVRTARDEADKLRAVYEEELRKIETDPEARNQPRWYKDLTAAFRRMRWFEGVIQRFESQQEQPTMPVEFHVIRLGDLAVATNPFEYYLDFGIYIKARSPAVQTLLVQLAGPGTYCPSPRSVAGGGYGSIPASNPVGPAGGRLLADRTIDILNELWG